MKQQLIVLTDDWNEMHGELFAFDDSQETPVFSFPVTLGKNGMAWGRGEHGYWLLTGLHKQEGDQRSPAGLFSLGVVFGETMPKDCSMPFLQTEETLVSVDDPASQYYNVIVSEEEAVVDWKSAERMKRDDHLYQLGVVVNHNTHPLTPGMGSCIFIHLWKGENEGTAGCTAMSRENIIRLIAFLDPAKEPELLQIPKPAYSSFLHSLRNEAIREINTRRLNALMTP